MISPEWPSSESCIALRAALWIAVMASIGPVMFTPSDKNPTSVIRARFLLRFDSHNPGQGSLSGRSTSARESEKKLPKPNVCRLASAVRFVALHRARLICYRQSGIYIGLDGLPEAASCRLLAVS